MRRHGFTAPELLLSVLLIMVATAVVMAANRRALVRARDTSCTSNVQQLALALHMYAADHDYRFPPDPRGWDAAYPYFKNKGLLRCPVATGAGEPEQAPVPPGEAPLRSDYLLNPTVEADDLASAILVGDDVADRHAGRRWIGARLDGSAGPLPAREWATRLGEVTENAEDDE